MRPKSWMDVGFACDRIERQEFARYEAIEVCEVERNSSFSVPSARAQKMRPKPWISEKTRRKAMTQISHAMRRDRQLRSGAKFAAYEPRERESGR